MAEGETLQDANSDENLLLEDLESYWDELSARLTVSRMVSDSIIRGTVNAISQEAAESISSKEEEIARLMARLQVYESGGVTNGEPELKSSSVSQFRSGCLLSGLQIDAETHLQILTIGVKAMRCSNSCGTTSLSSEEFNVLNQGVDSNVLMKMDEAVDALRVLLRSLCEQPGGRISLLEDALLEQQSQWDFERELGSIVLRNFLRDLKEERRTRLCTETSISEIQNEHRLEKTIWLMDSIQELDSISKSILSAKPGHALASGAQKTFQEGDLSNRKGNLSWNNHIISSSHREGDGLISTMDSDDGITEVAGSPLALQLPKEEELVSYYRNEINRIKRQLESSLHEKTEELFRLKREFLREKGSLWRKRDEDVNNLKKKFPDIILKLDKVPLEIQEHFTDQGGHDERRLGRVPPTVALMHEKEITTSLEVRNLEKLKKEILSLLQSVEKKCKFFSGVESRLDEQKGRLDRVLDEFNLLMSRAHGQQDLMSLGARLDEALHQIHEHDAKLCELNQKLVGVSNDLKEAEKEKANLREIIRDNERQMVSAAERANEQGRQMESIIKFVQESSESVAEFQSSVLANIQIRTSRF